MQAILPGVSALASLFLGNKATQQSPDQKMAFQGQTDLARSQSDLAKQMGSRFTLSAPAYGRALDYYSNLVGGNRGLMQRELAPETNRINDIYRGLTSRIGNTTRGAQRDQQLSEASREQAMQLTNLGAGRRNEAARTLLEIGGPGAGGPAASAFGMAGGAYGDISQLLRQRSMDNASVYGGLGSAWAKMWLPMLQQYLQGSGKGKKVANPGMGG